MQILHIDTNHELLANGLERLGCTNHFDYTSSKTQIQDTIANYEGLILRSRFKIDKSFLEGATKLKFIGRLGAGLENIDVDYAKQKGIALLAAPEGNRTAVGEHTLGLLLALFNKLHTANAEVKSGLWQRELNRGIELNGKTVGIIGYGNMGKAFAKTLQGFDLRVLCYDIKNDVGDLHAKQVSLDELQSKATIISLHTPQTKLTEGMINADFIKKCKHPFWFINTARGKNAITLDVVKAIKSGKILGAALDVLEYENQSFEQLFDRSKPLPEAFKYLVESNQVILTPHVAGWTVESKEKLAQTILDKIKQHFF